MELNNLFLYVLPVIALAFILIVFMYLRIQHMANQFQNYKADEFRQSIEKQIIELTKELSVNKERFNSINHLLIDAQNPYFNKNSSATEIWSKDKKLNFFGDIGAKLSESVDDKLVFVLTPFNEIYDDQYKIIKSVVSDLGFRCSRGDDTTVSSNILAHIVEQISLARIVIANISGRNPNVFYELGIAHALGKPVLIVSESLVDIPFDVNSNRILAFDSENDLSHKLRNWFVHTLARTDIRNTYSS